MSDNIVLFVIILCQIDLNAGRVSETQKKKKNTQKYAKIKGEKKWIAVWLKYACKIARA